MKLNEKFDLENQIIEEAKKRYETKENLLEKIKYDKLNTIHKIYLKEKISLKCNLKKYY